MILDYAFDTLNLRKDIVQIIFQIINVSITLIDRIGVYKRRERYINIIFTKANFAMLIFIIYLKKIIINQQELRK